MIGTFAKVGIAMCATLLVAYVSQKERSKKLKSIIL